MIHAFMTFGEYALDSRGPSKQVSSAEGVQNGLSSALSFHWKKLMKAVHSEESLAS